MGVESYNFFIYPKENMVKLTDDGWETYGSHSVLFTNVTNALKSMLNVNSYTSKESWSDDDPECYYSYADETCIIEIQINSGVKSEKVDEISVRFAVYNPEGTFEKAIKLCRNIGILLGMNVLDMKLHESLDFSNEIQVMKSKQKYYEKREQFFSMFSLPDGVIARPLYCSEVWNIVKGER
ncbi:hypothetical protein [Paenibacillus sp. UMB4589-SE434]|uniref:hypothetical protein n=1 Tax=Paenibacillus sp. UMB4589-SE434 TaxID=3046314 RepID=UPI00255180DF|nr:hypothetical protein [Paenibacillus sp. UMB4589-SE434]MDK8181891.1 hypothetical protein [Paenibacillus sp. UMB4589-SE434]